MGCFFFIEIINNYLFFNVICLLVVSGFYKFKIKNKLFKYLQLMCDDNDKIFVEKLQIIDCDIMVSNGVFYFIDDVIIFEEGNYVVKKLCL